MHVRVRVFATLSRYVPDLRPGTFLDLELPEGATILDLIQRLRLPVEEVKVAFVNGRSRPFDWPLQEGDEVGLFPAIAGG
ncbi:MAG: MoaD/ThiS family protein [Anaerolineae bacterium]|nr:MoaD/ThiS family protein [Anaerolineae bacterium]